MPEWNWQKIKQMLRDTLRVCHLRFWTFAIWKLCTILQPRYYPKIIGHILVKNKQKNKCVCFNEIIRLIIMKMEMKMKNTSHRYDINRTRFSHEHKYSKYKKHLSMTMLTCITQHYIQKRYRRSLENKRIDTGNKKTCTFFQIMLFYRFFIFYKNEILSNNFCNIVKGTLMQIWKSSHIFKFIST